MKDNTKELKLEEMETVSGGLFRLRENPKNKANGYRRQNEEGVKED